MLNKSEGCSHDTTFLPLQLFETTLSLQTFEESSYSRSFSRSEALAIVSVVTKSVTFSIILHLALAIVTFYRKSFTFSSHGLLCLTSGLASLLPFLPVHSLLLPPLLSLLSFNQLLRHRKSFDLQDALNYSGMVLLLLLLSSPLPSPWILPIILSPLQLIRKPASLLTLLRPLRVAAGPVSIISTIAIASGQLKQDLMILHDSTIPSINLLTSIAHAMAVLIFAAIAGIIIRPDNMSVLQLLQAASFPIPASLLTSYSRRVEIHALANAFVLLFCLGRVIAGWVIQA